MALDPQTWKPVGGKGQYPPRGFSPEKIEAREAREKVKVLHEKLRNGISRFVAKDVWGREYAQTCENSRLRDNKCPFLPF